MKTLLTEKEIYTFHKEDKISARTKYRIGNVIRTGLKCFKLVDKIVFKIDTCPYCGNNNTYHKRSQTTRTKDNTRYYDNVFRIERQNSKLSRIFKKYDFCLDCHKEFIIEIFCWKRIKFLEYLKERKNN